MSRRDRVVYEERDYYSRDGPPPPLAPLPVRVREREYDEDTYSRRGEPSRPDFLRDDYGRPSTDAGPVVLREREIETFTRPMERRPRSPTPVRIRERLVERSPSPPPPHFDRVRTRVVERERSPSPQLRTRVIETRERVRERSPSPVRIRERYIERERSPSPVERETIRIRTERESSRRPSPSPSPSPPPPPSIRAPPIHQEIITHHRHIDHGFERARAPAPTPPPPPRTRETKETDIDIYTSRGNTEVDISRRKTSSPSRSRTPQQPPPSSSMVRRETTVHDDSYIYERERDRLRVNDTHVDISRRRSLSARPPPERERLRVDIDDEADYYNRKVEERAYIGEAYNGATKNWAIVDVPPGTERVRMDGVGGGSQEITWQRYNGVRRSKFIPERERSERSEVVVRDEPRTRETTDVHIDISNRPRHDSRSYERYERIEENEDRRVAFPRGPPKTRVGDLWTEITKDLVVREAIEELGYDFEETEYFYYIIQYLRYEDVLELVELSETIRRERQRRIRQIEREREAMARRDREVYVRDERYDDERIVEREVIYDGRRPRRGHGW